MFREDVSEADLIFVIVALGISFGLYQGREWVRRLSIAIYVYIAGYNTIIALPLIYKHHWVGFVFIGSALVFGGCALALRYMKAIRHYFMDTSCTPPNP